MCERRTAKFLSIGAALPLILRHSVRFQMLIRFATCSDAQPVGDVSFRVATLASTTDWLGRATNQAIRASGLAYLFGCRSSFHATAHAHCSYCNDYSRARPTTQQLPVSRRNPPAPRQGPDNPAPAQCSTSLTPGSVDPWTQLRSCCRSRCLASLLSTG